MKHVLHMTLGLLVCISLASCQEGKQDKEQEAEKHEHSEEGHHEHSDGEHPEHPEGSEHPEHPEGHEHPENGAADEKMVSIDEFADAAEKYIKQKTEANGGYFPVRDSVQEKDLKLKLEKVHRERLSHLGNSTYFVCADFRGKDGNTYDVDIFMTGETMDSLEESRVPVVHKVNGEPRFDWYLDGRVWKRKEVS